LKRAVPAFIVEVRRRSRRATTSKPDARSSETKSPQAGFDRASHRPLAAGSEAKKVDPSLPEVASSPKGRILPSLIPDEALRRTFHAAPTPPWSNPPSRAPKPARTSKGKDQASKLHRNSRLSSGEDAPVAERASTTSRQTASVPSDEGAGVSPRHQPRAPRQVVGDSGGLALNAKAKRSDKIVISRDDVRVMPLPNDQQAALEADSHATIPSVADDRSPQGRKRTIMARYVFGDELKPGERWKRRLLKRQ
jgi:hypothetical protein